MKNQTLKPKRTFKKAVHAGQSPVCEKFTLPSETVPDQTQSLRQIINRFAQGIPPSISKELQYSDDMPDLRGLDIVELREMQWQAKQDIKDIQKELKSREKAEENPSPAPSPVVEPEKSQQS